MPTNDTYCSGQTSSAFLFQLDRKLRTLPASMNCRWEFNDNVAVSPKSVPNTPNAKEVSDYSFRDDYND